MPLHTWATSHYYLEKNIGPTARGPMCNLWGILLKSISFSNVRNFAGGPWNFELGDLTALCGANSAGKSTLIKCLLLLRANSKSSLGAERLGRIQFSDKDFDLGDFRSFASNNNTHKPFSIGLEYAGELPKTAFKSVQKLIPPHVRSEVESVTPYLLKASFKFVHIDIPRGRRRRPEEANSAGFGVLEKATFAVSLFGTTIAHLEVSLTPEAKSSFPSVFGEEDEIPYSCSLPKQFFDASGGGKLVQPMSETENGREVRFTPVLAGIFPLGLIGIPIAKSSKADQIGASEKRGSQSKSEFVPISLPPIFRTAIGSLRGYLDRIDYTAPLRAHAKRFYLLNQEYSAGNDSPGESIPYLLRDNLDKTLSVCLPKSTTPTKSLSLKSALNSWIRYLRDEKLNRQLHDEISIHFFQGLIADIRLHADGRHAFPLTDIGFGFSQVLPILVKGLLLPSRGTLIIEQPELHLHPAIQIRLAEFLLSLVMNGKSVVIETHSEHIINSLRAIVAEDTTNTLAGKIRILFISKAGSRPKIIDLTLKEDGSIPDFPKEFFGEALALSGRLLRAQKAKRQLLQNH